MSQPKPFPLLGEFLFGAPLYSEFLVPKEERGNGEPHRAYCVECRTARDFRVFAKNGRIVDWQTRRPGEIEGILGRCTINDKHVVQAHVVFLGDVLQKCGQFPSLADIALEEDRPYHNALPPQDRSEMRRAIGLAAHGVGIGAFVYMRRVFEHFIKARFDEFKTQYDWNEQDFQRLRMTDKIVLMRDVLPDFMVAKPALYGILSRGLHELDEKECLDFFPIARQSIQFIIEDDQRKRREREQRREVGAAIDNFRARPST